MLGIQSQIFLCSINNRRGGFNRFLLEILLVLRKAALHPWDFLRCSGSRQRVVVEYRPGDIYGGLH